MARKPNHQFEKRKREQLRAERAAERRKRKQQRANMAPEPGSGDSEDPDLAGIIVGPQPRDEISKEEARRAVERAMNPGKVAAEAQRDTGSSRIFVGSLSFDAREDELRELFSSAGFSVQEATIVCDRATGQSRGFAFVEVEGIKEAARAVRELDGAEIVGRRVRLSIAETRG